MKKIILLISLTFLIIVIPVKKADAQAIITAHASAEVIEALTATEVATLNFGRFSPETAGGEIRLTPDGVRIASGTVTLSGGSYNAAIFQLTGQYDASVTIALPTTPALLVNSANGKTMEVYKWESFPLAGTGSGILSKGVLALNVGATLKVGNMNENPVGTYAGTYSITFSYN